MRRGKPQQELYKPGSGKLRRSNQGLDDTISETGSEKNYQGSWDRSSNIGDRYDSGADREINRDHRKREKKPEREFYVPPVVAESRGQMSPQRSSSELGWLFLLTFMPT